MRVLVAFDKFKGSLSAREACAAAASAVAEALPGATIAEAPLTDGGDGFAEILTVKAEGEIRHCRVSGPRGNQIDASWGMVELANLNGAVRELMDLPEKGNLAIIEMARASGLLLLEKERRDPWRATSRGTGELLIAAAAERPAAILLGVGGSATHDLGLGALAALGLKGVSSKNEFLSGADLCPANWENLDGFSGSLKDLPPVFIASDVRNPLLGDRGAANVFAPQKGLRFEDLDRLEILTARTAALLCDRFEKSAALVDSPGSGAAGGIAMGLRAGYGAKIIPGFSLVKAWIDLDKRLREADLVLTGEGTFDETSLEGKGPGEILRKTNAAHKICMVLSGRIVLPELSKRGYQFCRFIEVSPKDMPPEESAAKADLLLKQAVREGIGGIARQLPAM